MIEPVREDKSDDKIILYKVLMAFVFNEFTSFDLLDGFKVPQKADDEGIVISFHDGRIAYLKIQDKPLSDDEFESILKVCYYLEKRFDAVIESYILCRPEVEFRRYDNIRGSNISLNLTSLKNIDGDATFAMLERKRKSGVRFTFQDCVCEFLLPYMGFKNEKVVF